MKSDVEYGIAYSDSDILSVWLLINKLFCVNNSISAEASVSTLLFELYSCTMSDSDNITTFNNKYFDIVYKLKNIGYNFDNNFIDTTRNNNQKIAVLIMRYVE